MKKRVVAVILVVCILMFSGCTRKNFKSYSDVYENGTTTQQLEYAINNQLLEKVGFTTFTFDDALAWKIEDAENEVTISYYFSSWGGDLVGEIESEILDYNIEILVTEEEYEIGLRGDSFSYRCLLSADDRTVIEDSEVEKKPFYDLMVGKSENEAYYQMILDKGVSLDDISALIDVYNQLTEGYLNDIYVIENSTEE